MHSPTRTHSFRPAFPHPCPGNMDHSSPVLGRPPELAAEEAAPHEVTASVESRTPAPTQRVKLQGLEVAPKLAGFIPCYTGPASQTAVGQGSQWAARPNPSSSPCSSGLGSQVPSSPYEVEPPVLGSAGLFLSHHLPAARQSGFRGQGPNYF